MSLLALLPQTATVSRKTAAGANRYGNTKYTWADAAEYPARLTQLSAEERQDRQVVEWKITLPAGADITAADRVVVESDTYEVVSDPYHVRAGRRVHHITATLRRVT